MIRRRTLAQAVLIATLGLAVGACATTVKVSSKTMCESTGGKYSQGSCRPGSAMKADAMCAGFGGLYLADEDLCHIPGR